LKKINISTPLLGLAFLTSAITALTPFASFARSAASNPRVGAASAARARCSAKLARALSVATSCALRAKMVFKISLMGANGLKFFGARD
jgi:hypothetical protein